MFVYLLYDTVTANLIVLLFLLNILHSPFIIHVFSKELSEFRNCSLMNMFN